MTHPDGRILRRAAVLLTALTVVAGGLSSCSSKPKHAAAPTSSAPSAVTEQSSVGSAAAPTATTPASAAATTAASTAAATTALAQAGIATVADETTTTPTVPVTGRVLMRFTAPQVQAMALQSADHGGILGSALDAAVQEPTSDVPMSYLLAAWVDTATSPGAAMVRAQMGPQNWQQAPSIVFPSIALPLFVSDVIAAAPAATGPVSASASQAAFHMGVDTPCSLVSGFIQGVIDTVFNALTLNAPSGGSIGATIGGFFVSIWNEAVSLAQQALNGLITAVTAPVVHTIEVVAGAAAVIAEVASYLSPWSVQVVAQPGSISAGGSGTFVGHVDSGPGADYPSSVSDCASALNVTLPSLSAGGADATWTLSGPLQASGSTSVVLDHNASSTLAYTSSAAAVPATCVPGSTTPNSAGSAQLSVKRPAINDLNTLANNMLTSGLGAAGGIVGPIVTSILQPLIAAVLGQLDSLTQTIGTGSVAIEHPASGGASCSPSPSATSSPGSSAVCLIGVWRLTDQTINGNSRGGAGAVFTYNADGTGSVNYTGSAVVQSVPPGNGIQYEGLSTIKFTNSNPTGSSGTINQTILTSDVTADNEGQVSHLPSGVSSTLAWTCTGNTATLTADLGGGFTESWHIARTGG